MSSLFGKRPKMPVPSPLPQKVEGRTAEVRKATIDDLLKRRRATVLNQVRGEPSVLRQKLGGA